MSAVPQIILAGRMELRPSPLQPRKHFDETYLNELGQSIRSEVGFINALVVRACVPCEEYPLAKYEIIAGECRWRSSDERRPEGAAVLSALEELPVVVRVMDDVVVLETMLAENMQRGDLTELEECDAFHRALAQKREDGSLVYATVAAFADKIGVPSKTVEKRLLLSKLSKMGRKAMLDGTLSYSVARVACECPEAMVAEVVECALKPHEHDVWLPGVGHPEEPLTAAQLRVLIEERFVRKLTSAPFDQADELLLPMKTGESGERLEGGACLGCYWNSATHNTAPRPSRGRQRGEMKTCANPSCFAKKVVCHSAAAIEKAKAAGHEVVTGADAEKLLKGSPSGTLSYSYIDLDQNIDPDDLAAGAKGKPPKWKDVVSGEAQTTAVVDRDAEGPVVEKVTGDVEVPVIVAISERGHVHRLVLRKVAVAAAAKTDSAVKLNLSAGRASSVQQDDEKTRRKNEQAEVKLRNEVTFAVMQEAMDSVSALNATSAALVGDFWSWMIGLAAYHGSNDAAHFVAKRLGLTGDDPRAAVKKHAAKAESVGERRALAVELLLGRLVKFNGTGDDHLKGLCKLLEVDIAAIEKRVRAEKKEAAAPKKPEATRGYCTWDNMDKFNQRLVRKRYKDTDYTTLSIYEYGFDAAGKVVDRRELKPGGEKQPSKVENEAGLLATARDAFSCGAHTATLLDDELLVGEDVCRRLMASILGDDYESLSDEGRAQFAKIEAMHIAGKKVTAITVQGDLKLRGTTHAKWLVNRWYKLRGLPREAAKAVKQKKAKAVKAAPEKKKKGSADMAKAVKKGHKVTPEERHARIAAVQRKRWAKARTGK